MLNTLNLIRPFSRQLPKVAQNVFSGIAAGAAATGPMTAAMKLGLRLLPLHERYALPPRQITMKVARELNLADKLDADERTALTLVAHYGYGGAMGGIYGALADGKASPANGAAFGLGVWAGSYLGLLPALGILKPATRHSPRRAALMIGAHLVWGAALGYLMHAEQTSEAAADSDND